MNEGRATVLLTIVIVLGCLVTVGYVAADIAGGLAQTLHSLQGGQP